MNILCFAPYSAAWDLHGYVEMGIAQALREKKANVINVYCDIDSEYCFLFPHSKANCAYCKQRSEFFAKDKNMPFIWLSRFSQKNDHEQAVAFVDSLLPERYPEAEYEGKKIGKWVLSTFISYLREHPFDWRNETHVKIYRVMLIHALEIAMALERMLKQGRYDRVLMFNGRFTPYAILLDMAEERGIPCYLHERGSMPDTLHLLRHDPASVLHPMTITPPPELLAQPLTHEQLEKTQALVMAKESSATQHNWDRYSPSTWHQDLRASLGIPADKRVWAFFVSSEDEMAAFHGYEYPDFPTQLDGLMRIIQTVSTYPDVHLVIRMHPNSGAKGLKRVPWADRLTAFLQRRKYPNVTVIAADDQINTYQLMDLAEVGLVACSSCAGEMLHRGKPAMAFHKLVTKNEGIFIAENNEGMDNILRRFHEKDISRSELKECFRKSLRNKYFEFVRGNIPFEIIKQTSPHTVKPLFRRVEEIKNARYPALNKMSDQILSGSPISFDYMDEKALPASIEDEDAWLDAYMERHFKSGQGGSDNKQINQTDEAESSGNK